MGIDYVGTTYREHIPLFPSNMGKCYIQIIVRIIFPYSLLTTSKIRVRAVKPQDLKGFLQLGVRDFLDIFVGLG